MNKKIRFLLLALCVTRAPQVYAYGAATLLLYGLVRTMIDAENQGPEKSSDEEITQRVIDQKITFADVVGAHKAKNALMDVVNALKNPELYTTMGAQMPKGVLLEGGPGNGKTLLAKALAYEAGISFIAINGADFTDKFVGEGVRKVKELFAQARAQAPCIIFIDEIDAIGIRGQESGGGAQTENNRVITELLTQLDGMSTDSSKPIIVVGATNNKDLLDQALLRSGRFDVIVRVEQPTQRERKELLKLYSAKTKLSDGIDFDMLAARTKGFSGADCANLVNQAALCAVRRSASCIEQRDFMQALEARTAS